MAEQLKGITIALAGPRKAEEMAKLIQNMGGTALHRPAQGTSFLDDAALRDGLTAWTDQPPDLAVLTTGMGLDALFEMAAKLELADRFLEVLSASPIAARGYKTVNALKKRGLEPVVRDDDGSTKGLIRGLQDWDLQGKRVRLQLHGESAPHLVQWLEHAGAEVSWVQPYRYTQPGARSVGPAAGGYYRRPGECGSLHKCSAIPFPGAVCAGPGQAGRTRSGIRG